MNEIKCWDKKNLQVFKAKGNGYFKEHQEGINPTKGKKSSCSSRAPRRVFWTIRRQELTANNDFVPLNHPQLSWFFDLCQGKGKTHVVSYVQTFQATELASSQRAKLPLMASHIYEPTGHIFTLTYLLATVIST